MQEIKMPSAGQTTDEATIVTVNVKVGDTVKRGDVLCEAETDKAVLPVESFAAGQVFDVLVKEGDKVNAGSVLVVVGKAADAAKYARGGAAAPAAAVAPAAAAAPAQVAEQDEYLPIIKGQAPAAVAAPAAAAPVSHPIYPAMPNAKMMAKERDIDIKDVVASNGQFIKRVDVENYVPAAAAAPVEAPAAAEEKPYEVMPMTRMRQIIGKRMKESLTNIPCWQ